MDVWRILCKSKVYYDSNLGVYRSKSLLDKKSKETWDEHWSSRNNFSEKIISIYRKIFIGTLVSKYCDKYFKDYGVFLEAGCGIGETSAKIPKRKRIFIGCDISIYPLLRMRNNNIDIKLQADIFDLPLNKKSIDGIFNVGVMEHFTFDENIRILKEFARVLKDGGTIVLFWPWKFCWVELVSKVRPLFPSSPSMFGTFDIHELLSNVGSLDIVKMSLSPLDGFIHYVIVLTKIN